MLITFSSQWIKKKEKTMNSFYISLHEKINIISKNGGQFYPFFHFSMNNQKRINRVEKETFIQFGWRHLKVETINARTLLKSFQPIHRLINIGIISSLISNYKIKKWNIDNWSVDNSDEFFWRMKERVSLFHQNCIILTRI